MTDISELKPLVWRWVISSIFSVVVITITCIIGAYIPDDVQWMMHRYLAQRIAALALAFIMMPAGVLLFDYLSPGGSFVAKIGESAYGPAIFCSSLCIALALVLCYV